MKHLSMREDLETKALDVEFWRSICPWLTITQSPFIPAVPAYPIDEGEALKAAQQVAEEGYFRVNPIIPQAELDVLVNAVRVVAQEGFPASFVLVFDEIWQMLSRLGNLMSPILGPSFCLTRDIWIYYIRAQGEAPSEVKEESGWAPHRDGKAAVSTLKDNGLPLILNAWIPLTDISVEHSHMNVLPTNRDPAYPSNLAEFSIPKSSLQDIRALPVNAGAVLGWNEYALHWGSRSSKWASGPRISIAVRFQSREVEPFDFSYLTGQSPFEFQDRLGIICTMMRRYQMRATYPSKLYDFCDKQAQLYAAVEQVRSIKADRAKNL